MVIKSAEITLAVHYRSKDENNEAYGGPNYYMKKGIGMELGKKKAVQGFERAFHHRLLHELLHQHSDLYGSRGHVFDLRNRYAGKRDSVHHTALRDDKRRP